MVVRRVCEREGEERKAHVRIRPGTEVKTTDMTQTRRKTGPRPSSRFCWLPLLCAFATSRRAT
jgi:hypothetical protein